MVHVMQIEIRHTTYKRDCLYNVSAYSLNEMHKFMLQIVTTNLCV